MPALGLSLKKIFQDKTQPKKLDERLDMAIQLSWKLYRLHEGHDSLTHTPYAHMDIKPDNVTRTNDGQLHLIDFGLTEKYPKQPGRQKTQAHTYVAYKEENQELTKEQYDVIAIKRIIHLPDSLYGGATQFISRIHEQCETYVSFLSQEELDQFQLNEYINTFALANDVPDYTQDKTSAIMLCALLINARYNLQIDSKKIANDPILMHAITGFYFNDPTKHFAKLLFDDVTIKLMAALNLLDVTKQYDYYSQDAVLCKALERASMLETMSALVGLKMRGLEKHFESVLQSSELAEAINTLIKAEFQCSEQDLLIVLNDHHKNIAKAILFLKYLNLQNWYQEVIKNPALAMALINMTSNECKSRVVHMLESNEFTADEIMKVASDQRLAKAANHIKSNIYINKALYVKILKLMIAINSNVDTCLNIYSLESLNDLEKFKILMSPNKCQAFNFLFASNIKDNAMLVKVLYDDDVLEVFLRLQELKMETLYLRPFQDHHFTYEAKQILSKAYASEVSPEMLCYDQARRVLYDNPSVDTVKGLQTLIEMGFIGRVSFSRFDSATFKCINFLSDNGFLTFLKWLIDYPSSACSLNNLLKPENADHCAYDISSILNILPQEKRLEFIQEIAKIIDLKILKSDSRCYFEEIKSALGINQQDFFKIIYTDEEQADKQTLKNIKSSIKATPWSYSFFDPKVAAINNIEVPISMREQISILKNVKLGVITYSKAVSEMKRIGREQCETMKAGTLNYCKHTIFGKSETEKYYDQFETDESFVQNFVK